MTAELEQLEDELQEQLQEQEETLAVIIASCEADPCNAELQQMREQLGAAVRESQEALLQLKRDRLLRHVDALAGAGAGAPAMAQPAAPPEPEPAAGAAWQTGQRCVFRFTDGRFYMGLIQRVEGEAVHLRFATPTRQHQLAPLELPAHVLAAPRAPPLRPHELDPGARCILQPPGAELWVGGEVAAVDPGEGRVEAVTEEGARVVVPLSSVALSAHAPNPWEAEEEEGKEDDSASELSGSEGESGESEGGSEEGNESGEDEDEDSTPYGRVSLALSSAAAQAQAAAEAGPQTDTQLFSAWEAHTRGIGSKMLAGMGYKGGGLGRGERGIAAPLEAAQLKKGAGLGVEPSSHGIREGREKKKKKRKRGGRTAQQRKASKAAFEQREAGRQRQQELESRTGTEGVFAFINTMIGDDSAAAAVQRAHAGASEAPAAGGAAPNAHLFAATPGAAAGAAAAKKGGKASKAPDRRALASQQDRLAQLRQKVGRLADMAKRNAGDKVMLPQIKRALAEAQQQLGAAEREHSWMRGRIEQKEKEKKWGRF